MASNQEMRVRFSPSAPKIIESTFMDFRISELEENTLKEFAELHRDCKNATIGGKFTYMFTKTGLGTIVEVRCNVCGEINVLSDSSDW